MDAAQWEWLTAAIQRIESKLNTPSSGSSTNPVAKRLSETKYEFNKDASPGKCRQCDEVIYWHSTRNGKNIPLDHDGTVHFETCAARNPTTDTAQPPAGVGIEDVPF